MKTDNTLETAKNLGRLGSGGAKTLRAKGFLGQSDRINFYKFNLSSTGGFRASFSSKVQGGKLRVALGTNELMDNEGGFAENKVKFTKPSVLRPGKNNSFFVIEADLSDDRRNSKLFYVKFFRPTKDINYNFRIDFKDLD